MKKFVILAVLCIVGMWLLIQGFDYLSNNAGNIGGYLVTKFFEFIKGLMTS